MTLSLRKNAIIIFLFMILPSLLFAQTAPNQSAPVNGSTWETTSPSFYWWYTPNPFSIGPFDYSVQVSTNATDFSGSFLIVDAVVSAGTAGSYAVPSSAGISVGNTYYWRVGVNGNYSAIWSFSPNSWGWGGGGTYYTITASAGANGTISPSGTLHIAEGTDQTFTITPDTGYEITDVEVDNVSVGAVASYDFTNVTADHSISATFQFVPVMTYVAVTGDDMNGDGSSANPYRTIQHALDRTDPGGTVFVYNGNYEEDVYLTKPVTLLGEANPSTSSMVVRANNVKIKNFNVYAKPGSGPGPGIQKVGLETYDYLEYLTLENVQCYNNDEQGLLIENMGHVTIKNSRFFDNQMGGIGLAYCSDVSIENVGLEGNLRGMWAHGTSDLSLSLVYVEDNGKIYPFNYPDQNG
ncbi:MAG: DUF1565 domain-containing protein, partial [Chlorobi bacterium]|nr:DUF1565 domain-containing protein [Chlorobiota bacterium]